MCVYLCASVHCVCVSASQLGRSYYNVPPMGPGSGAGGGGRSVVPLPKGGVVPPPSSGETFEEDEDYMNQEPEGMFHTYSNHKELLEQVRAKEISLSLSSSTSSSPFPLPSIFFSYLFSSSPLSFLIPTISLNFPHCPTVFTPVIFSSCRFLQTAASREQPCPRTRPPEHRDSSSHAGSREQALSHLQEHCG